MSKARAIIAKLGLEPHPEGGWYRETWRPASPEGVRPSATAIHFLLEADQASHWHTVDAAEFWLWHAGDCLPLSIAAAGTKSPQTVTLGGDVLKGEAVQQVIEAGHWQAAGPPDGENGYTLVSCIVAPGFEFSGFKMAPPDWAPGGEN